MAESEESVGGREVEHITCVGGWRWNTKALTVYLRVFLKTNIVFWDIQKLTRAHKFIKVSSTMANVSTCSDIRGFEFIWWHTGCFTVEGRLFQAKILFVSHWELFSDVCLYRSMLWQRLLLTLCGKDNATHFYPSRVITRCLLVLPVKTAFHCSNVSNQANIRQFENHDPTPNIWVDNKLNYLQLLTWKNNNFDFMTQNPTQVSMLAS